MLELSVTGDPSVTERIESICEPPAQYFSHRRLHIDIGAHHGDTVAAYALRNPGCSGIIALEPDRVSYGRLCENTAGMPAVTALNCAASDREGISRFSGGGGRGSALDGEGGDAVRTVTVDSLCGNTAVGANGKSVGSMNDLAGHAEISDIVMMDQQAAQIRNWGYMYLHDLTLDTNSTSSAIYNDCGSYLKAERVTIQDSAVPVSYTHLLPQS